MKPPEIKKFIKKFIPQVKAKAIQIGWGSWDEICRLGEIPNRAVGVWVDTEGKMSVIPTNRMGLLILADDGSELLGVEGDWLILYEDCTLTVCDKETFGGLFELEDTQDDLRRDR
jgi:hypothetical protein